MSSLANAQQAGQDAGTASVRLEAHAGQTHFALGEPIVVDLVFTASSGAWLVNRDAHRYQPPFDTVEAEPGQGWVRTRPAMWGQPLNAGSMVPLGADAVRVPVIVNRTLTFEKPGYYTLKITTDRLRTPGQRDALTTPEDCKPCRTTNGLEIELTARDEASEAALTAQLVRELAGKSQPAPAVAVAGGEKGAAPMPAPRPPESATEVSTGTAQSNDEDAHTASREQAATQLAFLGSDEAVRAKVRLIVAESQGSEDSPIAPILREGLPAAHDRKLQLQLLEEAWRDPKLVPNAELQTALRQAAELATRGWVTEDRVLWEGTPEQRRTALDEFQREISELLATLPQRPQPNREATVKFLRWLGVGKQIPKQFDTASPALP